MQYRQCVYHYCDSAGDESWDMCKLEENLCQPAYGNDCEDFECIEPECPGVDFDEYLTEEMIYERDRDILRQAQHED